MAMKKNLHGEAWIWKLARKISGKDHKFHLKSELGLSHTFYPLVEAISQLPCSNNYKMVNVVGLCLAELD